MVSMTVIAKEGEMVRKMEMRDMERKGNGDN
jgi:hypothetical protein